MIHAARDYLVTSLLADGPEAPPTGGDGRPGYGSVAMDMLAPSHWSPVETVRARSWHDVHLGEDPQDPPGDPPRGR
jgi:hypothetical protein